MTHFPTFRKRAKKQILVKGSLLFRGDLVLQEIGVLTGQKIFRFYAHMKPTWSPHEAHMKPNFIIKSLRSLWLVQGSKLDLRMTSISGAVGFHPPDRVDVCLALCPVSVSSKQYFSFRPSAFAAFRVLIFRELWFMTSASGDTRIRWRGVSGRVSDGAVWNRNKDYTTRSRDSLD